MICITCHKNEINTKRSKIRCNECLDRLKLSVRKSYRNHRDRILAYQKDYYKSNLEQVRNTSKRCGKVRKQKLLAQGLCTCCGKNKINYSRSDIECDICLNKNKTKSKEYYPNNKKKIQAGQRRSVHKNHQKYLDIKKKYYRSHKEKYEQWMTERRGRVLGVDGKFTRKEWKELLDYCGNKCLKCGTTIRLEADHVIPISIGGNNSIDNIQPLCRSCNAQKHVDVVDYRPYIDWT